MTYPAPESPRNATPAPGWCSWLSKQMSLQPLRRVQWQAAVTQCWWQTVPQCGSVDGQASLTHRRLYSWQVDTFCRCGPYSWGRPLTFSTGTHKILADMEVLRRPYSIRGPQSWKWSFAIPKASGGCVVIPPLHSRVLRAAVFCTDCICFIWVSVISASRALQ